MTKSTALTDSTIIIKCSQFAGTASPTSTCPTKLKAVPDDSSKPETSSYSPLSLFTLQALWQSVNLVSVCRVPNTYPPKGGSNIYSA